MIKRVFSWSYPQEKASFRSGVGLVYWVKNPVVPRVGGLPKHSNHHEQRDAEENLEKKDQFSDERCNAKQCLEA